MENVNNVTGNSVLHGDMNHISGNARVHDAELTACEVRDNAYVEGGTHYILRASSNAHVACRETDLTATFTGDATVKGDFHIIGGEYGGKFELHDFNALPETVSINNYWNTPIMSDISRLITEDTTITNQTFQSVATSAANLMDKHPEYVNIRFCLNSEVHSQNMPRCRCALWLPLILLGDPAAIFYFLRAEGKLQPCGDTHRSIYAEGTLRNPYYAFSATRLEKLMRVSLDKILKDYWLVPRKILQANCSSHGIEELFSKEETTKEYQLSDWHRFLERILGTPYMGR